MIEISKELMKLAVLTMLVAAVAGALIPERQWEYRLLRAMMYPLRPARGLYRESASHFRC